MASLNGQPINTTYSGLLKTSANTVLGELTAQTITDGEGNTSPLSLAQKNVQIVTPSDGSALVMSDNITISDLASSNGFAITGSSMDFAGNVDFSGATVTGLGGGAGLVSGAGLNSMKSADTLTDLPAQAGPGAPRGIAIGRDARALGDTSLALGNETRGGAYSTALGNSASALGAQAVALGFATNASGGTSVAIGRITTATSDNAVALGREAQATAANSIAIGTVSRSRAANAINIGNDSIVDDAIRVETVTIGSNSSGSTKSAQYSTSVGSRAFGIGDYACAYGHTAVAAGSRAIAIGYNTQANINDAVALGANVTAVWGGGVTMNQLALVNYATLDYADDTAAAAGGVPLGGVYHTSGALKIRLV